MLSLQVKLTCSLRWLCGVLANTPLLQGTSGQTLSKLLLEPYKHDNLNRELVQCLTIPRLYMGAYNVIYPNERLEGNSFEPLFHALAKRGGYVLEDDHNIVTDPMLVQSEPFRPVSRGGEGEGGRGYENVCMQCIMVHIVSEKRGGGWGWGKGA